MLAGKIVPEAKLKCDATVSKSASTIFANRYVCSRNSLSLTRDRTSPKGDALLRGTSGRVDLILSIGIEPIGIPDFYQPRFHPRDINVAVLLRRERLILPPEMEGLSRQSQFHKRLRNAHAGNRAAAYLIRGELSVLQRCAGRHNGTRSIRLVVPRPG